MPSVPPSFSTWHSAHPIDLNRAFPALRALSSRGWAVDLDLRRRQGADEGGQGIALVAVEVQPRRLQRRDARVGGLGMAGNLEPHLDGRGRQDELAQGRGLGLPAEPADAAVGEVPDPPLDLRRAGVSPTRSGLDRRVGDRVDQADAEQRGRVPLRRSHRDRAVLAEDPLAPDPVVGVVAVPVQDHPGRVAEARMNPHQLGNLRRDGAGTAGRRARRVADPVLESVRSVVEREGVIEAGRVLRITGGRGRDDLDIRAGRSAPAAGGALVVASDARSLVVDRPEPVAPVAAAIVGSPLAVEQLAAPGDRIPVLRLRLGAPAASAACAGRSHGDEDHARSTNSQPATLSAPDPNSQGACIEVSRNSTETSADPSSLHRSRYCISESVRNGTGGFSGRHGAATLQTLPVVCSIRANSQPVLPDRAISCRFPVRKPVCAGGATSRDSRLGRPFWMTR